MDHLDQPEIRLLGPTLVRRADGSVVRPSEWRSSKTLDLLRLLAINCERPAQTEGILGQLWPEVPTERARASLRTAAYQIRHVLGDDCVLRRGTTLQLNEVWFDAHRYWMLAAEVDVSRRSSTPHSTVALAREAEALYVGDLEVEEPCEWLENARERLRLRRHALLLDAAEAAVGLNWMRDALDFASSAHAIDPQSERTARVLMRALGGLGEIEKALAVFELLRHDLADQFGADLSPQTRALHVQLLTGTLKSAEGELLDISRTATGELVQTLETTLENGSGQGVVLVSGEPGSGRDSVVASACRKVPADVVVVPKTQSVSRGDIEGFAAMARRLDSVVLVRTQHLGDVETEGPLERDRAATGVVRLDPLTADELADTARAVLQGEPTDGLLSSLNAASRGLAGCASTVARRWLAEGRVVWTVDGLALTDTDYGAHQPKSWRLQRLLRAMNWQAVDVLTVLALIDAESTAEEIGAVLSRLHPGCEIVVPAVLDRLADTSLVEVGPGGYRLRNQHDRSEVVAWLRPSARHRLHRLIAELVDLEPAVRIRHLLAGGAHQAACDLGYADLRRPRSPRPPES